MHSHSLVRRLLVCAGLVGAWLPTSAHAAFPGANGPIAYVESGDGNQDIWVATSDGVAQQLTTGRSDERDPAVSPDGHQIAFASNRSGRFQIYVKNVDGTQLRRITRDTANDTQPAWSPGRGRIAFTSDLSGRAQIYSIGTNGGTPLRITHDFADDAGPAWSPKSGEIAFESDAGNNVDVYVVSQQGGVARRLTTYPGIDFAPAWSPDGTTIAFSRDGSQIDAISDGGANQHELVAAASGESAEAPAWSPDGTQLAFATGTSLRVAAVTTGGARRIAIQGAPGAMPLESDPDWGQLPTPTTPDPDQSATARPVGSGVTVTLPGSDVPVDLVESAQIPIGSVVNASSAALQLTVADPSTGETQSPVLSGGSFAVQQSAASDTTTFVLRGRPIGAAKSARRHRHSHRRLHLTGHCHHCGILGHHGRAAGQGTEYLTEDLCAGTLTRVLSGTVLFDDFTLGRTFVLTAGQSHLARAPRREEQHCGRRQR